MLKIEDFKEIYIEKDDVILIDIDGEKTKRSIYVDSEHRNYFIYDEKKYYFTINMLEH